MATKIFICSHTDFECPVSNPIYKVMDARRLKFGLPVSDAFYSEWATFKYLADKGRLTKFVGCCQYRRYFDFMNSVPEMEDIFKEYNVVATMPMRFNVNVRDQYARSHNVEDLDIVTEIVKQDYPQYYAMLLKMLQGRELYANDMFVMRREDFKEMTVYVFGVLDKYLEAVGTDIEGHIEANKDKYIKKNGIGDNMQYQFRIGGYLAERLASAFIMQLGKVKKYKIKVVEKMK